MIVYLIVQRDEKGKVFEIRVQQSKLTEHIDRTLASGIEVLAVIRL